MRWAKLWQARYDGDSDFSRLYKATAQELTAGAGLPVDLFFKTRGVEFGTIASLVDKGHRFGSRLSISQSSAPRRVPISHFSSQIGR